MIREKDIETGVDEQKVRETRGRRLTWGRRGETGKKRQHYLQTDMKRQEAKVGGNMQEKFFMLQGKLIRK